MLGTECIAALLMTALAAVALAQPAGDAPAKALPLIVAHRGLSSLYPENTVAAVQAAWENGADAVETDFHLTADGQIVCIHDGDAKRTTGEQMVVAKTPLAELRKLDAGKWKGEKFAGERLPTLQEVLANTPPGKLHFLELKTGPEIVPEFVRQLRDKNSPVQLDQVRMITFNRETLRAFKVAMPEVKAYLLSSFKQDESGKWNQTPDELIAVAKEIGADGLDLSISPKTMAPITPEVVAKMKSAGLEFHAWTIDSPEIAQHAIDLGTQSITTNRCGALRDELLK